MWIASSAYFGLRFDDSNMRPVLKIIQTIFRENGPIPISGIDHIKDSNELGRRPFFCICCLPITMASISFCHFHLAFNHDSLGFMLLMYFSSIYVDASFLMRFLKEVYIERIYIVSAIFLGLDGSHENCLLRAL